MGTMSEPRDELETTLGAAFAAVAGDVPDASGLAAGARRRHRARRQRRAAAGGIAAVLVLGGSAVALAQGGDGRGDVAQQPDVPGWRSVQVGDARFSVPDDWDEVVCTYPEGGERTIWADPEAGGTDGADACASGGGAIVLGGATFDPATGPGTVTSSEGDASWGGYVGVGDDVLSVQAADREVVLRILASAHLEGQPDVETTPWVRFDRDGMIYDVPAWWGVGEDGDRSAYAVCAARDTSGGSGSADQRAPDTFVLTQPYAGLTVSVAAPTQAVAELVMAGVRVEDGASGAADCTPEDFSQGLLPPEGGVPDPEGGEEPGADARVTVAFGDISAEVPVTWAEHLCDEETLEYSPYDTCTGIGEGLRFADPATYDPPLDEGEIVQHEDSGEPMWGGWVRSGDWIVLVNHPDRAVTEAVLASVRP